MIAAGGCFQAPVAWSAPQDLLLDVTVNGVSVGKVGAFELDDGNMSARQSELTDLGLKLEGYVAGGPDALVSLASLPGVRWTFDPSRQSISLTISQVGLIPTVIGDSTHADTIPVESATGAVLNYDVTVSRHAGQTVAGAAFDARLFSPLGVLSSDTLLSTDAQTPSTHAPRYRWIRLDTTYTYSDARRRLRYRLGDFITDTLTWTRPLRVGGAQLSADFSMRPDLITFPLPSFSGSALVPSTVDVFVDGTKALSQENLNGPFVIPQLPVVTGAGTVSVAVTDALGRQVIVTKDFYASAALLQPGLQTFSLHVGKERLNWGSNSNDYVELIAGGIYRRGLTQNITVEATAETRRGVTMAGGGLVANLGNKALMQFAVAGSQGSGLKGYQIAMGLRRLGPGWSAAASMTVASPGFRDVAAFSGSPVPRLQAQINGSVSFPGHGSVGLAVVAINPGRSEVMSCIPGAGCSNVPEPVLRSRIVSLSYTVQLSRMAFYVTGFADMASKGSRGIMIGVTLPLGTYRQAGASVSHQDGQSTAAVDMTSAATNEDPFGYRLMEARGSVGHHFAELSYRANWALLTAGIDQIGHDKALRAQAQGALVLADGQLFAANAINDSFAIVESGAIGGVTVLQENRVVGRTSANGRLLVPDLRAFEVNRLAIDPADVPPEMTMGPAVKEVRPPDRSGVIVPFQIRSSNGALLALVDENHVPIPLGSVATLDATGRALAVGYDGAVYATQLKPSNQMTVRLPDGHQCRLTFDYKAVAGNIPRIGPLVCLAVAS